MLIHLTPRIYAHRRSEPCALIDVTCAELGLFLNGGTDLITRRPYKFDKNYLVACPKVGQKSARGFLFESPQFVSNFTVVTRWMVGGSHISTHRVHYLILDEEFDAVSDNMTLWAMNHGDKRWKSRWPDPYLAVEQMFFQPRIDIRLRLERNNSTMDAVDERGIVVDRSETFLMHTLERARLHEHEESTREQIPGIKTAFTNASGAAKQS